LKPKSYFRKSLRRFGRGVSLSCQRFYEVTALAGAMSSARCCVRDFYRGNQLTPDTSPGRQDHFLAQRTGTVPVDRTNGPMDEWSGDVGCGVCAPSQQVSVARLAPLAGIEFKQGTHLCRAAPLVWR
jgi:hypothetical protein